MNRKTQKDPQGPRTVGCFSSSEACCGVGGSRDAKGSRLMGERIPATVMFIQNSSVNDNLHHTAKPMATQFFIVPRNRNTGTAALKMASKSRTSMTGMVGMVRLVGQQVNAAAAVAGGVVVRPARPPNYDYPKESNLTACCSSTA